MFKNLRAEMAREKLTNEILAKALGLSPCTMSAKLNNVKRLKYVEAKNIQTLFFPRLSTDYIFELDEDIDESNKH